MTDSIICEKEIDGEPCGAEIPLIPENLAVLRPEVPLLRSICPVCGNSNILTKEVSIPLADMYFKEEIESKLAGDSGDEVMPSAGFAEKVKEALDSMGYNGKKYTKKVKTICEFVETVPMYQTSQGLHQLLAQMGIDNRHIQLIVIKVFGTNDMINRGVPDYSFLGGQPQGNVPNVYGQPAGPQNPNQQQVGPYIQTTTPQGQVILIPNPQPQMPPQYPYQQQQPQAATQPIIIDRGGVQSQDEKITISEKVDHEGHVVERIISQPKTSYTPPAPTPNDGVNSMKDMVEMLGTMGVFKGNEAAPGPDPQIDKMEARHEQAMAEMRQMNQQQQENLTALKDQMHQEEINNIKGYMGALDEKVKELSDPRFRGTMNTEQAKIRAQTDNLGTVSDHLESLGDRVLEPLAEAQKMQARTNGAITIRQMEIQEGLAPGTLLNVVFGNAQPSNDDVKVTTDKWQKKAKE
ncbi:MAG: hypothetical protein IMY70_05695 [Bacteroidetes bacterium]|nr:hypothetical protein [Bacteroidota bacterium]